MNFNIDDIITFNYGEYLILDVIREKDNTYLYLINNDEFKDDVSIVKVNNNNDVIEYSPIENEEEFDFVVNKIFLDFKEDVVDFATEQ
ncbi:DUF1292 domain-containing protein [Holdemanella sp. SCCA2]|nr:DUF1292 domain-containing protein [Holdemanella sp. SCCA2]